MKKIISLLTFAAALLMPLFAASQNGFSAGVNWFTPTENRIAERDFNGFGIDGAYKIGIIKRLYVEPHMGIYTSIHLIFQHQLDIQVCMTRRLMREVFYRTHF